MSFLSRKPGRPGSRDDVYDDYDDYAADGYQSEDDGWSPNQYFSPEGIKGRWAGEQPDGRAGGRGRRENGRGDAAAGRDSSEDDPFESGRDPFESSFGGGHGAQGKSDPRGGYGADEYASGASGAYELPEGADDDRQDRGRRRRSKDREDRGERTGILRLRRDRGEDIWPDDGISDEDYWASVAADRPLTGADLPRDGDRGPAGGAPRRTADPRPGDQRGSDLRGTDQRGGESRGVTGRLGPPPGLAGDYKPGGAPGSGPMRGIGQPGGSRASGPMPARPGTGPTPVRSATGATQARPATGPTPARSATGANQARSATGPTPSRPGTGPTPTVGVTSSRPPAGPNGMRPGPGTGPTAAWQGQGQQRPGSGSGGFPQSSPRPSFQPNGFQPGGGPAGGRQQDRADWGDRTERIERVNASGYPDPRPAARSTGGLGGPAASGPSGAPGRGRRDSGSWRNQDPWEADRREPDRREADRRDGGRDTGGWAGPERGGASAWSGANDDPLTSQAYSRSALGETDGRSYRMAARRSQAQATLTEHTETFITGQYQSGHTGDYPAAGYQPEQRTGEYRAYRGDAPATAGQLAAGRQPGYGGQDGRPANGRPAQQPRAIGSSGGSGAAGWPAQPGGQYDAPQRQPQQQRPQAQPRQAAPLPAAPLSAPVPSGNGPATGPSPAAQPGGRPAAAKGGLNPYDAAITGSYPYPGQTYSAARPGPAQAGVDDPYYRPLPADGYPSGGGEQGMSDPARAGYGASYGNGYPDPRDQRY